MALLDFFVGALVLLRKQPKLFPPKILVALLYGLVMLLTAQFAITNFAMGASGIAVKNPGDIALLFEMLLYCILLLFLFFFVNIIDIFTNALYPTMVKDFFAGKKISIRKAMGPLRGKLIRIFFSAFFTDLLLLLPFALMSFVLFFTNNQVFLTLVIALFLFVYLIFNVAFYFLYPLLVLDSVFFFRNFAKSISLSKKKILKIFVASLVPYFISVVNFCLAFYLTSFSISAANSGLAFFWQVLGLLLLFLLLRFLVAIAQTYHMVLNPSIFLKYKDL